MTIPSVQLNSGTDIPQLGFGLWQVPSDQAEQLVSVALETGYRHIDTAAAYGNEEEVGRALANSGIPRDDIFVTTKLWNGDHGSDRAQNAFEQSLRNLNLDAVDLYLIHWPLPMFDQYVETWKVLEEIHASGRARAIGVSNFPENCLQRLLDECDIVPAVNQVELHPRLQQRDLRRFNADHGIVTEAWSPIGQGKGLLTDPTLGKLAADKGRSPAQVVLRWHIQLGNVVFPKSVHPERIRENFAIFDFELSDDDMGVIDSLETGERLGPDPETFAVR